MSCTVTLCAKVGHKDGPVPLNGYWANYTGNVGPMFYDAFPTTREGRGSGLQTIDGMEAWVAMDSIRMAIRKMEADPEKYEAMNPFNGCGSYQGALAFLKKIEGFCVTCNGAIVVVS